MKHRRLVFSASIPEPLYMNLLRMCEEENITISWAATKALARSFGLDYKQFESGIKKPKARAHSAAAATQVLHESLPLPASLDDILSFPNRSRAQYGVLLSKYAQYVSPSGTVTPIPETDKKLIRKYMEKYGW